MTISGRRAHGRTVGSIAGVVCALALVAGCTEAVDDEARVIDDADVPFGLLDRADTTSPTSTTSAPTGVLLPLYFVSDDGLVRTERRVPSDDPAVLIDVLVDGPSQDERAEGWRSALSTDGDDDSDDESDDGGALITSVALSRGIATVDLAPAFTELSGDRQLEAIGQIVLTLTSQPGVGQVGFTLDASPVDVVRADGTTTSDPVARADYRDLLAGG